MLRLLVVCMLTMFMLIEGASAAPNPTAVPSYDIKGACQALAAVPDARLIDLNAPDATRHCVEAEEQAHQQLLQQWSRFASVDRSMCLGVSRAGSVDPVYTELMTCLEMARDSEQDGQKAGNP
jgi:hypothetical protein